MKVTPLSELHKLRSSIENELERINPHKALTELAVECRKYNEVELRHAALSQPYQPSARSLHFLEGAPCFVALAALNLLHRGHTALVKPLRDVMKTAGSRADLDEQLHHSLFSDSVKAFTAKRTAIRQFLSSRFDGCAIPRDCDLDALVAGMQRETLSTTAGFFESVFEHSDRFAPTGVKAIQESIQLEEIQRSLMRG